MAKPKRKIAGPRKDCLGRPVRYDEDAHSYRGFKMLSDDQIDAIANEVRTKPLSEVGRHVMPLIHHIAAVDDQICQSCRHWVPYNAGQDRAARGECTVHASGSSPILIETEGRKALLTPFDWGCKGWDAGLVFAGDDAQSQR